MIRQSAFFLSLLISLFCGFAVAVSFYLSVNQPIIMVIGSLLVSFTISFLLIYFAQKRIIQQKKSATSHEITKKKSSEDSRERTHEINKLRKMENYRKEFLGNVSHELKTPIFNIQGYILTLLDGGLEDPEINRIYLERTENSISRMINIIEDLESISKLEAGELELKVKIFDIVQLIKEVFELQDTLKKKYDVRLVFEKNYDKPVMVSADRKRMTEVINNLVVNSIVYGNKGGATRVRVEAGPAKVEVTVTDEGIGIKEEEIPRIFERFYRTDRSRSRDRGGTGLGLSIVKHIIEAHNQTINVISVPGKGSRFSFTLDKA